MFRTVLKSSNPTVIAVMLKGMGKDGAEAMLELGKENQQHISELRTLKLRYELKLRET
jgi:chemotaxis response regulator CheB